MLTSLKRVFRELKKPRIPSAAALQRAHDLMARQALKEGNVARDHAQWDTAADRYAAYVRLRPDDAAIHVQLGNALREAGDLAQAEAAYRRSLALEASADRWLQLGRTLSEQGRRDDAISAVVEALRLDPAMQGAHDELIKLDARLLAPRDRYDDWPAHDLRSGRASTSDVQQWRASGRYPLDAWSQFRRDTVPGPPPSHPSSIVDIIVDGTDVGPARIRSTLIALRDQSLKTWTCRVLGPAEQWDHSVGAFADIDARISFVSDATSVAGTAPLVLSLSGGTVLHADALAWLVFAQQRTDAAVVFADHDHHIDHWRDGPRHIDPVLYPLSDPVDMASTRLLPDAVLMSRAAYGQSTAPLQHRQVVIQAIRQRTAAHVPLVLSSLADLPAIADRGSVDASETRPDWLHSATPARPSNEASLPGAASILVVMPTRDQADLLAASIASLQAKAARPDLVSILIVDNRSREPHTVEVLATLSRDPRVRVMPLDAAFNWSRCNNLGAAAGRGDVLLFVNNDTEMLTQNWDETLRSHMADLHTGVVGARLLYPDLTVQHVGMVCGSGGGAPMHEGVGAPREAGGPGGRWHRDRLASAVTGAFMAVRRDVFDRVGGFDQDVLMIGYNDVDFCLRVRAAGFGVVFVADIEMIHYESKTRGLNDTRARAAWDQGELKSLYSIWGPGLLFDPGVNPHWDREADRPFSGYSQPDEDEVLRWIDLSASADPWSPEQALPRAD